jgi:hypothetical protein
MLRHLLMAAVVLVGMACMVQDAHATTHCCKGRVADYLFGGYGRGPFGHGYFPYAGYMPRANCTECGHRIW